MPAAKISALSPFDKIVADALISRIVQVLDKKNKQDDYFVRVKLRPPNQKIIVEELGNKERQDIRAFLFMDAVMRNPDTPVREMVNHQATVESLRDLSEEVGQDLGLYCVGSARVSKLLMGAGIGWVLYRAALISAGMNKAALAPDGYVGGSTSDDAFKMWARLAHSPGIKMSPNPKRKFILYFNGSPSMKAVTAKLAP